MYGSLGTPSGGCVKLQPYKQTCLPSCSSVFWKQFLYLDLVYTG